MLHGRSAETARIDEQLTAARDGRSGALVIRGEAGVGKTALLDYASAAAGMRVLRGTGIESEAELPFAALQLLRPELGRLDVLPPPQAQAVRGAFGLAGTPGADRFLIGLAALSLLAELAGDAVLLCVVDDAPGLRSGTISSRSFSRRTRSRRPCASARLITRPPMPPVPLTGPPSRWPASPPGPGLPVSRGHGPCCTAARPSPGTVTRKSITARRCGSTRSAAVRSTTAAPSSSTANGCAAAGGARMPALTCAPRSRSSIGPGPRPGPNGPGPSCARPGSPRPPGRRRRTG